MEQTAEHLNKVEINYVQSYHLKANYSPTTELILTNCVIIHPTDIPEYVKYVTCKGCLFTVKRDENMSKGQAGFTTYHHRWAEMWFDEKVEIIPWFPERDCNLPDVFIRRIVIDVDFCMGIRGDPEGYVPARIVDMFKEASIHHVFSIGQPFGMKFNQSINLLGYVRWIEYNDFSEKTTRKHANYGLIDTTTEIVFVRAPGSPIRFIRETEVSDEIHVESGCAAVAKGSGPPPTEFYSKRCYSCGYVCDTTHRKYY